MASATRPRYGVLLASILSSVVAVAGAVLVTAWALLVLPFAFIIGVCAYSGLTLAQTWEAMDEHSGDDAGRGPAGMSF